MEKVYDELELKFVSFCMKILKLFVSIFRINFQVILATVHVTEMKNCIFNKPLLSKLNKLYAKRMET